jgi:transcriptional antiterminator NusG
MVTKMVMEEQKDNLELTESSLDKQEGNIQEINSAEAQLEENSENVEEVNALEENAENQDDINALDHQEHTGESGEDELKKNADQNANNTIIEKEETELEAPKKPQNPNAKWYILQAYAGYEGRVEKTINEKLKIEGLEHLVDEIFIPSEDIVKTKDGQKRKINQKYFPGYVLVRMELTPELWHLLMEINRVSGFIGGTQKSPLPLEDVELEKIRSQISEGSQQKATEEEFSIGEKVTITEGSFGNFSGTIDEINQERRKLKVLVSIFGRPTPVEVEFDKVKHVLE